MSFLARNVIDESRRELKDTTATYRWDDTTLLRYLNDGLYALERIRPDAFLNSDGSELNTWTELTSTSGALPVSAAYRSALSGYVTARALMEDAEDSSNKNQAELCLERFAKLNPNNAAL